MNYLTNYYKNLSEQLQQKVDFLQKTLNEAYGQPPHDAASRENAADLNREFTDIAAGEEAMDTHMKIADLIARHHSDVAPHISDNLGSHNYNKEKSKNHIFKSLTTSKTYLRDPFTSVEDAVEKIGGEFMPAVIYPEKGNPHWGNQIAVSLQAPNGEIHPHNEELVWDRVLASIDNEDAPKKNK